MHLLPLTSFLYLNVFTQENWIISHFKQTFQFRNNLFDLNDKLTVGVLRGGKAGCKCLTEKLCIF